VIVMSAEQIQAGRRPHIGILGIMQDLYDDMIPGIAQRQEGYAAEIADQLSDVAEFTPGKAIKYREDAERAMREFENSDLDGVLVVMLTYGPAMRVARLLSESRLPVCLANIQPEPTVTPAWDMADMTYNQGVHGAQDTANAMVRAGKRFAVLTDDWKSATFREDVGRWARAAAAVTAWKRLKVAIFGYAMNEMGDIRVDESALVRTLGPAIISVAQGDLYRGMQEASEERVASVITFEDEHFEIDPRLSVTERTDHARMQVAIEKILNERGFGAYTAHFDAIGEDGRFSRLPLAAASSLMAKGYGYAAEGDVLTACLVYAGHVLIGDAHFTEMYAMDGEADQAAVGHRAAGRPADVPVPVPAGPGHPGHAGLAGRRAVPAGGRGGPEPGQPGAAGPGDAVRAVPARVRAAQVPQRMADGRRPASRGDEPGPSRRRLEGLLPARRHRVRPGLAGRWVRGVLAAVFHGCWSLTTAPKFGCGTWGRCVSLQRSGLCWLG
jgi:L-arabinose isomerase